jgi:hypothetical protein
MKKRAVEILGLALAVIQCLIPACSTSEEVILYEITGPPAWTITWHTEICGFRRWTGIFTGDTISGIMDPGEACWGCGHGSYSRTANDIIIFLCWMGWPEDYYVTFRGTIMSGQSMSGTWEDADGETGTWQAVR